VLVFSKEKSYHLPTAAELTKGKWKHSYPLLLIAGKDSLRDLLREPTLTYIAESEFQRQYHNLGKSDFLRLKKTKAYNALFKTFLFFFQMILW